MQKKNKKKSLKMFFYPLETVKISILFDGNIFKGELIKVNKDELCKGKVEFLKNG